MENKTKYKIGDMFYQYDVEEEAVMQLEVTDIINDIDEFPATYEVTNCANGGIRFLSEGYIDSFFFHTALECINKCIRTLEQLKNNTNMENKEYIKLPRECSNLDKNSLYVLVMLSYTAKRQGEGINTFHKGEVFLTQRGFAEEIGVTIKELRGALDRLSAGGYITILETSKVRGKGGTVLKINNYLE